MHSQSHKSKFAKMAEFYMEFDFFLNLFEIILKFFGKVCYYFVLTASLVTHLAKQKLLLFFFFNLEFFLLKTIGK